MGDTGKRENHINSHSRVVLRESSMPAVKKASHDFLVRQAKDEDWLGAYEILQSPQVVYFTGHATPPSKEDTRKRWETRLAEPNVHTLVAETTGQIVGYVRMGQGRGKGSHVGTISTILVHPNWQYRGIGTRLAEEMLNLAYDSLGLKRLRITVHADNQAAIHIYEKLGFEIEGTERQATYKDGKYVDILVMGRVRD